MCDGAVVVMVRTARWRVTEVVVGVLAVLVGALLCFRGYLALRVVISLWGAFFGLLAGAAVVASATGEPMLSSPVGWLAGLVGAVLFGVLAYLWYVVAVVIGLGAIGFSLGASVLSAVGAEPRWAVLGGVALGLVLAVVAIAADLPRVILAVVSAFAGASTILGGVLLLMGRGEVDRLDGTAAGFADLGVGWLVAYLALAVVGIVVQMQDRRVRPGAPRDAWSAPAR